MNWSMNFVEQVMEGDVLDTEIDDFVEQWHQSKSDESLAEFLGFTDEEFALWVEQPEALRSILFCRKHDVPRSEVTDWQQAHRMAARSQKNGDPNVLLTWLKKTGRLD
jgi:hypothetical protein